jgi:hypothetical protein
VHLYYFGSSLRSSLLRTWAKSPEAREHTGFIIMDRERWSNTSFKVSKLEYAPQTSRPYGVELPMIPSLCGCWTKAPHRWKERHRSRAFGEEFYFYTSSCCLIELHIAIYNDRRVMLNVHGTRVMEEPWDSCAERFTFDPARMICIKISVCGS